MIISLNWLKQFVKIDSPVEDLAELIGSRLVEVERVVDLGRRYKGAVIAQIKRVAPHPGADRLSLVGVDPGPGRLFGNWRRGDGLVEVVCGASNLREGMKVVWLPPGAVLPASVDKKPETLSAKEVRGAVSAGMLASAKELALGDDHSGILEVDSDQPVGTGFAEAYQLNDYLLDIENKSLTHRPDCFGLIGFAREVAAISGQDFQTPKWLTALKPDLAPLDSALAPLELKATVDADLSERYQLVALDDLDASKTSPLLVQTWLARVGIRPISAAVDVTNYLMYLTGQPLHAFDLDKFLSVHPERKAQVAVRQAKPGESLTLLDGRAIRLNDQDIVICAGPVPVALAGAMGGASTAIDSSTKRLLLESATFNLYRLRNTQMRHGIFSEAVTRFTKGQPAAQTAPVLASAVRMLSDICLARRISQVVDVYPGPAKTPVIHLEVERLNRVLGTSFSAEEAVLILRRAEIDTRQRQDELSVHPPYWRADLRIAEDVIEEIGRLSGYDHLPAALPLRPMSAALEDPLAVQAQVLRRALDKAGANEVLTYSFVSQSLISAAGQNSERAFKVVNALSGDLQHYRLSLTPSLLEKCRQNLKSGYQEFALFEIGKLHDKRGLDADGLPLERPSLALVYARSHAGNQPAYYAARRFVEHIAGSLKLRFEFKPLTNSDYNDQIVAPYLPERSALLFVPGVKAPVGVVGELKDGVLHSLKLPPALAGLELDLAALAKAARPVSDYRPSGKYPGTEKDLTLRVPADLAYAEVARVIGQSLAKEPLDGRYRPLSIYRDPKRPEARHITFRIDLSDHRGTITTQRANQVIARLAAAAAEHLGARQV